MPTTKDIKKVAEEGNKFLNSSINNHQKRLTEAISQLEKNIIDQVKEFKTTDGTLLGPRVNMKQAQKVHAQLTKMFDETYGSAARDVVKGFNSAAKYIQKEFKTLEVAADFTSVDKDMIETLKRSTWGTFNKFGLQTQELLVDKMYNSIIGKSSFSSLVTDFQGILSGHKDVKGRPMTIYANLYANDSIMNFHNSVHMKKAVDAGMKYFMYYGNLMATSRDFCIGRTGKVFSKEVIDSWDEMPWGGKSGPAFTNRGGYNCRHRWVAVRKNWLDKDTEVIEDPSWGKEVIGAPRKKIPIKSRDELLDNYVSLRSRYDQADWKEKMVLREGMRDAEIAFARMYSEAEFLEAKTQMMERMTQTEGKVQLTKAIRDKFKRIADWVPYDLLYDMEAKGCKIVIKDIAEDALRAQYENFTIYLAKDNAVEVYSHEFGHMIDGFLNGRDPKTGFLWRDGRFVTQKEAENLKKWFASHHPTNQKGVYTNGDGEFWKNNWLDDYEGRIYGDGYGQEWWAMNIQRYSGYRYEVKYGYNNAIKAAETKLTKTEEVIAKYEGQLAAAEKAKDIKKIEMLKGEINYEIGTKQITTDNLERLRKEGAESYAARISKWDKAKERYPNLTNYIEKKFGKPFILAEGQTAVSAEAVVAKAEKEVVKKAVKAEAISAPLEVTPKVIDISKYAKDYDKIKLTEQMAQAEYADIQAQIKLNLDGIRKGTANLTEVSGEITDDVVKIMKRNMVKELQTFDSYLAGDTVNLMRDYIDNLDDILRSDLKAFKGVDAKNMNDMFLDSIRKLIHQEIESNRQAFTDHGIRHIVKNILFQNSVIDTLAGQGIKFTARDKLLGQFVMVQHDVGYTVPLIREGGLRGVKASSKHPLFSTKIAHQQKNLWNVGKIFSEDEYRRAMRMISTHDSTSLSMKDPLAFATRVSDNLALFQKEKLPSFFQYVDGGQQKLLALGQAAKRGDVKAFEQIKNNLYEKIDESDLNKMLKRDLKQAVSEVSNVTPKFTMGVLAGEITSVGATEGSLLSVEMTFNKFDQFLQSMFDMGQKQAKKFLGDYGIKEFDKGRYLIGNYKGKPILEIRVKGAPAELLKGDTAVGLTRKVEKKVVKEMISADVGIVEEVISNRPELRGLARKLAEAPIEGKIIEDLYLSDMNAAIDSVMNNLDLDTLRPKAVKMAREQIYERSQYELKYVRKLPEEFTVYRGGSTDSELVSVSLNPSTALRYARGDKTKVGAWVVKRKDVLVDINGIKGSFQAYPLEEELIIKSNVLVKSRKTDVIWDAADRKAQELAAKEVIGKKPTVVKAVRPPWATIEKGYERTAAGTWVKDGKEVSEKIAEKLQKMGIPPAWTDVQVSLDPKAKVVAAGRDSAGRWQPRYSAKHWGEAKKKKFDRISSFGWDIKPLRKRADYDIKAGDPRAYLVRLEDKTGIRAGTKADLKAKKKAYGLTTLQGRHVTVRGNKIILEFTAKEGIPARYEFVDDVIAPWLAERKAVTGANEFIFRDVPARVLNKYIKQVSGKKYTIKDFRTFHGTKIAYDELKKYVGKEFTKKEKKAVIKEVTKKVSEWLRNTPSMAKKSYIDPMVWELIGGLP